MIQLVSIGIIAFVLFMVQQKLYEKAWNRDLSANISFASSGIFEGQEGSLVEVIENQKRLPLSMLKVKFQADRHLIFADTSGSRTTDQYYRNDIFQINGKERLTRTIKFKGGRRGYYTIESMDLVAGDLFLSTQFVETHPVNSSLYVYPKIFDSDEFRHSLRQLNGEVLTKRHLLEDPFEYRGIREYQPTDDMRSINWKATAKTGDFKVNQKNYTALQAVRIFINTEDKGILKKEDCVEACLQIAAGLCQYFLGQGIRVSCYGNGLDKINHQHLHLEANSGSAQLEAIYRALARMDISLECVDFVNTFHDCLFTEAKGTITCFISPNHYEPFLNMMEEYQEAGNDFWWYYPVIEATDPVIPDSLTKRVKFLHINN